MKNLHGDILVSLSFYSTAQGGRAGATPPERFGCLMEIDSETYDIRMHLETVGPIFPGQSAEVLISFLDWEHARAHCSVGKSFLLREAKTIGEGVIKEIRRLDAV